MNEKNVFLAVLLLLAGCAREASTTSASVSFDAQRNKSLSAQIVPIGVVDKDVVIEGTPDSDFKLIVEVSYAEGDAHSSSGAEISFRYENNKLTPSNDYIMSGGGERPALRRESDREITVYYPDELQDRRTWA